LEIWRTRDRAGRDVVLTSATRDHILRRHAKKADRLAEIRTATEHPDLVARDVKFDRREIYYRRTPSAQGWMRFVVYYGPVPPQGIWAGEVITSYYVDEPNVQEVQLWP